MVGGRIRQTTAAGREQKDRHTDASLRMQKNVLSCFEKVIGNTPEFVFGFLAETIKNE
jgi:hypothetical protein